MHTLFAEKAGDLFFDLGRERLRHRDHVTAAISRQHKLWHAGRWGRVPRTTYPWVSRWRTSSAMACLVIWARSSQHADGGARVARAGPSECSVEMRDFPLTMPDRIMANDRLTSSIVYVR
jgi:hypothetical protein